MTVTIPSPITIDQTPTGWRFEQQRPYYIAPMHQALVVLPDALPVPYASPVEPQPVREPIVINTPPYEINPRTHVIAVTGEGHRYALHRGQYVYGSARHYCPERDAAYDRLSVEARFGREVKWHDWMLPLIDWQETYNLWGV